MQGCLYDIFCRCADSTPERTRLENLKSEKVRTWKSQVKHTELEGLSGSKIQDPGFFPLNSFPRENYFPQTKIPKKIHWGEIISLNIFPRGKLFPKFFPLGVYFFLKSVPSGAIISNLFPRGKLSPWIFFLLSIESRDNSAIVYPYYSAVMRRHENKRFYANKTE